ncbi:NAD-dependent epimerase/dehydratase family protein [Paenibacillus humicola]|uniref:NAD-dependent epimerase/dehydratase family protein n=1 Tax=Paenibacillus humicola TaxID=3110540 RepID=UPI00237AA930|nr:NAD-dependent epimerase/dehydratase family protein [Paenibacillus humicola]
MKDPVSRPAAKAIKVIITGVTGMVGEGVLHECLNHPDVAEILAVGRRPCGVSHPKLTEIVHGDFFDLRSIASRLTPYDACFFCLGVSSVGMKEEAYKRVTYDLTMHMAELLAEFNPDMTFVYVTGQGTDSTERGRSMWARVKGRTENDLLKLPFKAVYMFRPGYMHPTKGLNNTIRYYAFITWMYPVLRRLWPNRILTLREVGIAMIHAAQYGYSRPVLEPPDIARLAGTQATG